MTARAYYVHGVQLVGVDSLCECCEQRPAVGRSIKGHAICARCAGWAAREADELAEEIRLSRERTDATRAASLTRVRHLVSVLEGRHETERPKRRVVRENRNARREAASAANVRRAAHSRGIRHAAIEGAMAKIGRQVSVAQLADLTGLSRSTIKRTLTELVREGRISFKRAHKSSTLYYAVKVAS